MSAVRFISEAKIILFPHSKAIVGRQNPLIKGFGNQKRGFNGQIIWSFFHNAVPLHQQLQEKRMFNQIKSNDYECNF